MRVRIDMDWGEVYDYVEGLKAEGKNEEEVLVEVIKIIDAEKEKISVELKDILSEVYGRVGEKEGGPVEKSVEANKDTAWSYRAPIKEKSQVNESVSNKPECKLVGEDGNVFNIIGRVSKCLKSAGLSKEAEEYKKRCFSSGSYDEVLKITAEYVEIV